MRQRGDDRRLANPPGDKQVLEVTGFLTREGRETVVSENMEKENIMGRPIEILLVEDNPGDVRLTIEALKEGKVTNNLQVARDGEEAMELLHKKGRHTNAKRPDIILLDLNLPKKDGRQVLAEIKTDDDLKPIPVVVLTMSKAEEDILETYQHHANCYITKPLDMDQFMAVMKQTESFWLTIVKLPPKMEPGE